MPPPRHPLDKGYRAHNTNVYPQRPDRCYLAYIDGGMFVLDISDKANPKRISQWTNSPPYTGFMHTVVPLFDRGLMLVTDESTENNAKDWPKLIWVLDAREETNLVPISTCPLPDHKAFAAARPLRRPQHPRERAAADRVADPTRSCSAPSSTAACAPTTSPIRTSRRQIGVFVPPAPPMAPDRHHPAQRRVRRRARDRLHRRPPRRRALHPGDGFLMHVLARLHAARRIRSHAGCAPGRSAIGLREGCCGRLRRCYRAASSPSHLRTVRRISGVSTRAAPRSGHDDTLMPCSISFPRATPARSGGGSSARAARAFRSPSSPAFSAPARPRWCGASWPRPKARAPPSSSTNSAASASTTRWCAAAATR